MRKCLSLALFSAAAVFTGCSDALTAPAEVVDGVVVTATVPGGCTPGGCPSPPSDPSELVSISVTKIDAGSVSIRDCPNGVFQIQQLISGEWRTITPCDEVHWMGINSTFAIVQSRWFTAGTYRVIVLVSRDPASGGYNQAASSAFTIKP